MKFKIFVGVMLFIMAASSVVVAGAVVYGAMKVKSNLQSANTSVSGLSKQTSTVNQNLQSISGQLQAQSKALSASNL